MESEVSTSRSIRHPTEGPYRRFVYWVLVGGNRLAVSLGAVVVVVLVFAGLIAESVVGVGPNSTVAALFGGGLMSGIATLITIALSVNQLILSRVFGSPDELSSRLQGSRDLRRTVQDVAGEPTTPNDPAAFMALVGRTLRDRAAALGRAVEESPSDPPADVATAVGDLTAYGENIEEQLEEHASIVNVLDAIVGTEYAENLAAVERLGNVHADSLSSTAKAELEAIEDLLEAIAVTRQFLKTLFLQQDFGDLARHLVFSGFVAIITVISVTLVYQQGATAIDPTLLLPVVSLGIGVVLFPFAVFGAYSLRAAVIARQTVSVGPFIPPEDQ
jgi:hypothetical protein